MSAPYRLPVTVKIGPYTYTISRDESVDYAKNWGEARNATRTIAVGTLVNRAELPPTLIHELLHVIGHNLGLTGLGGSEEDERYVEALSNGLTAALQDLGVLPREMVLASDEPPGPVA